MAKLDLPLRTFDRPTWYRGHKAVRGPLYFNPSAGRFAAPDRQYGTLYLGEDEHVSFLEAFNQEIADALPFGRVVSARRLANCCLCPVTAEARLTLVDLTNGAALRRLSPDADNRINDGPHAVSQRWALAFWQHPTRPDGLFYRSRRAPERCAIALYDRAAASLRSHCDQNVLRDPDRLAAILISYGCALIP
jgi:RES domain